ncbi:MAG: formylglycine-generating enzyme family protein [Planctomycetes bacterium]|nr:formylglycine-generating enzyme family protein [Planctomycetota bacterium]
MQAQAAVADLAVNPAYRDRLLVFRLVPAGTALLGQAPGTPARQGDEAQGPAVHGGFAIAALELTRAQWRRLAGDAPWQDAAWSGLAGGDDDQLPATGMSAARAGAVLAAAGARLGIGLALPQPWQWEVAARAGGAGAMPWGDDLRPAAAAAFARTAADGSARVGSLLPNALGLHDCCGNVWELTADGGMRGGSWADPPALARPANRDALLVGDGAPHVGLRPVYRP